MTGKSKKQLEEENIKLKEELARLSEKLKNSYKCKKSSNPSENVNNLKEYPSNNTSDNEIYKCAQCKKNLVKNGKWVHT